MSATTLLEAVRAAMAEEMRRDPDVCVMGEDIGEFGGAFQATAGLLAEFGPLRVLDTPITPSARVGAAVGAALMGLRPIVELQYSDFLACAFEQIVNSAAKQLWRTAGALPAPLVIRAPTGGGTRSGPWLSQSPEAWFLHAPGIKVVVPATAHDAKGLLKAAIRDDDPVLFLEHKLLYRRLKEELPAGDYVVPLGRAAVRRPGHQLTVLTYGAMVYQALAAAETLAREDGAEAEVLDLRTLAPLDREAIGASIRKTNRVLVVHEATRTGGVGAELAAIIAEEWFGELDAPIARVTAPDTPFPYAPALEAAYLPQSARVVAAARKLLAY
ncbi:MAG TPA: alpha-ketoacid dehydrogenase subunit beta [Ktedonobacterales bacterium]|jgi:2-oxoisovalerate dehydrogenase E1 component beta subunit